MHTKHPSQSSFNNMTELDIEGAVPADIISSPIYQSIKFFFFLFSVLLHNLLKARAGFNSSTFYKSVLRINMRSCAGRPRWQVCNHNRAIGLVYIKWENAIG